MIGTVPKRLNHWSGLVTGVPRQAQAIRKPLFNNKH
jgi:hypothetical protein